MRIQLSITVCIPVNSRSYFYKKYLIGRTVLTVIHKFEVSGIGLLFSLKDVTQDALNTQIHNSGSIQMICSCYFSLLIDNY